MKDMESNRVFLDEGVGDIGPITVKGDLNTGRR
jgi:hypothetical protein